MVIQKIKNTKTCHATLKYIQKEDADLIYNNTITEELSAREMEWIYSKNHRVKKPMVHIILSLQEEESLTASEWKQLCQKYLKSIGYGNNQYIGYRHNDTKNEHIHLLVNRVQYSNLKVTDDSYNVQKGQKVLKEIEKEFNLKPISLNQEVMNTSKTERKKVSRQKDKEKLQQKKERKVYREAIDEAIEKSNSFDDFSHYLRKKSITVSSNLNSISYQKENCTPIAGGSLGKKYTIKELKKHLTIGKGELDSKEVIPQQLPADNKDTISTLLNVLGKTRNPLMINYSNGSHYLSYDQGELIYTKENETIFSGKYEKGKWQVEENQFSKEQLKVLEEQIPEINKHFQEQRQFKQKRQRQRQLQL